MPRRQSKCRLCQNHGILTPLRGHKYKCPFSSCSCFKCKTTQRQRATQRHSRVSGTNGYQLDGYRRKIDDVESDEDVRVTAWINGEEEQEETAEARASEQAQNKDEHCIIPVQQTVKHGGSLPSTPVNGEVSGLTNRNKVTTSAGTASGKSLAVKLPGVTLMKSQATAEARTQILKQIKDLHDLRQSGALSTKEFEDAKAVVLRDFK